MLQEGEIEWRAVNDRGDALEQLQDLCAGLEHVDDRDALPAAIELSETDLGPVRVEPGKLGVFYFTVQCPSLVLIFAVKASISA